MIQPLLVLPVLLALLAPSAQPSTREASPPAPIPAERDVPYKTESQGLTDYERSRCKLDVYKPAHTPAPYVVWFHGGGLTEGSKEKQDGIVAPLLAAGIGVVTVNYRLSPRATYPAYVDDAAAAVVYVIQHASEIGADPAKLFVSGHSAGGYLCAAISYDPSFLGKYHYSTSALAGCIPISPQVFTHYTVRAERSIPDPQHTPLIDEAAPAFFARADAPPTLIFWGDHDIPTRAEECKYFLALLKSKKHPDARGVEVAGRDHGSIVGHLRDPNDPVGSGMIEFIRTHSAVSAQP